MFRKNDVDARKELAGQPSLLRVEHCLSYLASSVVGSSALNAFSRNQELWIKMRTHFGCLVEHSKPV